MIIGIWIGLTRFELLNKKTPERYIYIYIYIYIKVGSRQTDKETGFRPFAWKCKFIGSLQNVHLF